MTSLCTTSSLGRRMIPLYTLATHIFFRRIFFSILPFTKRSLYGHYLFMKHITYTSFGIFHVVEHFTPFIFFLFLPLLHEHSEYGNRAIFWKRRVGKEQITRGVLVFWLGLCWWFRCLWRNNRSIPIRRGARQCRKTAKAKARRTRVPSTCPSSNEATAYDDPICFPRVFVMFDGGTTI